MVAMKDKKTVTAGHEPYLGILLKIVIYEYGFSPFLPILGW